MASVKYEIEKLDRKTLFPLWKTRMMAILTQMDLEDALLGRGRMPAELSDEKKDKINKKAVSQIQLLLSNEILQDVLKEDDATSLCRKLEEICMKKNLTNKLRLKQQLYSCKLTEGTSIQAHIDNFKIQMAQQRPAWFRFAGFSLRPSAPAPAPAPAPTPPLVRPSIPIRAPLAPTQTQEPAPSLPQSAASSLPPTAPPSPPPPPRTTLATPAPPTRPPVAQRQRSPFVPPAPQPSPVRAPVAASPTAAPAPKSPTPAPLPTFASPKVIPSSAKTTSPVPKPVETDNGKALSPKMKPLSRPPSSFALPPTKMEHEPKVEQKTVLVQETIDKPLKNMHDARNYGGIASNGKREPTKKDHKDTSKKLSDSEERGMRLVTLAGENRGAVMELSASSHKKTYTVGNDHPLQKNKNDKSSSESGEEGKPNQKDETNKAMKMRSLPVTAFFNSNVQGVNNSIVHNSTHSHNDPGIRLSLTGKPKNGDRRHHG